MIEGVPDNLRHVTSAIKQEGQSTAAKQGLISARQPPFARPILEGENYHSVEGIVTNIV